MRSCYETKQRGSCPPHRIGWLSRSKPDRIRHGLGEEAKQKHVPACVCVCVIWGWDVKVMHKGSPVNEQQECCHFLHFAVSTHPDSNPFERLREC